MSDPTGTGFLFHFVKGTSTLLATLGPSSFVNDQSKDGGFFRLARMFEMTRALMFWDGTFLDSDEWRGALERSDDDGEDDGGGSGEGGGKKEGHCVEKLYGIIHRTISLNARILPVFDVGLADLENTHIQQLKDAAIEGLDIRECLDTWYLANESTLSSRQDEDSQTLLAKIYHPTILLNITNLFDAYPHFYALAISISRLSSSEIQENVNVIISLVEKALRTTRIAGFSLLWPVRVAGGRSITEDQRSRVLKMLREIEKRGFVVAGGVEGLIREKWVDEEFQAYLMGYGRSWR